jgi:hypothetical protein
VIKKYSLWVIFILVLCFGGITPARADKYTHALGTTGYMLREAMQAGAPKIAKDDYREALKKQSQAKKAFHKRALEKSLALTQESYVLAKKSRDEALQSKGRRF